MTLYRLPHLGAAILHGTQSGYSFALANTTYKDQGFFKVTNHVYRPVRGGIIQNNTDVVGEFRLANMVAIFPLLSMINHLWAVIDFKRYEKMVTFTQTNPVRWIEYAVSASLMFMVISILSSQSDIKSLAAICLGNVAMQYIGYMIERQMASCYCKADAKHLEIIGFIVFAAIWTPIACSFFTSLLNSEGENLTKT